MSKQEFERIESAMRIRLLAKVIASAKSSLPGGAASDAVNRRSQDPGATALFLVPRQCDLSRSDFNEITATGHAEERARLMNQIPIPNRNSPSRVKR